MIRFINTTGTHNKWWSIAIMVDSTHNTAVGYSTRWGKIGCAGQSKDTLRLSFGLINIITELVASKIRKGYVYQSATIQNGPEQDFLRALVRRGFADAAYDGEIQAQNIEPIEFDVARNIARTTEAIRRAYEQTHQPVKEKSIEEILADKEMDRFADLLE